MAVTTNASFDTQAAAVVCGTVGFVELAFEGGTERVVSWPVNVTALGYTWTGVGSVLSMSDLQESEDGVPRKMSLRLSVANSSYLALALQSPETYQGRSAKVWVAAADSTGVIQGDPVLRFVGVMDLIKIDPQEEGGAVILDCESAGYDPRSNPTALRLNDAQHQFEHPGELGFQYVNELIAHPQLWLSKKFQQI